MKATSLWSAFRHPVLWFSRQERLRRRGLKTLAVLHLRGIATRSDIAAIGEHTTVATQRLVDHRRTFDRAQEAVQESQVDLQTLIDRMRALGVTRSVKP